MKLIPISEHADAPKILYDLLAERTPDQSISHREMPTWEEHCAFVAEHPYEAWYLLEEGDKIIGATYITEADEIGLAIFTEFQRQGYGKKAVGLLLQEHPREAYFANIASRNEASKAFWQKLGFGLLQETYSLEPSA